MNVERVWRPRTSTERIARAALYPLSSLYGAAVALRNALYDRGVLRTHPSPIPVVSVGNLTVGGTGKTPVAAYLVHELAASGRTPAVVMRGYGDDELHLHARMNPGVRVFIGADRAAGIAAAAAAGADVVVMDDAFQHRRAERDLDIVLVSAEQWRADLRLLPAGPLREPLSSLARADVIIVTRKSAADAEVAGVVDAIAALRFERAEVAVAALSPSSLVAADGSAHAPLGALRGSTVLAIAGIGDPESFFAQLRQLGAVVTGRRFPDHHDYTAKEVGNLVQECASHKYVVTTEKDAVKLCRHWPAVAPELWYLSQAVRLTEGASLVAAALAKLFTRATSIVG